MSRVLKLVIVSVFSRKLYPPVELWIITGTWDVMKNWVEKDVLELSNHKVNLLAAIVKSLLKWIVSQTKHNATKILTEALGWICLNETLSGESIICAVLGKTPNLSCQTVLYDLYFWEIHNLCWLCCPPLTPQHVFERKDITITGIFAKKQRKELSLLQSAIFEVQEHLWIYCIRFPQISA